MKDPASRAELEPEVSQAVLDTMLETIDGSIIDAQTALNENMVSSGSQITRQGTAKTVLDEDPVPTGHDLKEDNDTLKEEENETDSSGDEDDDSTEVVMLGLGALLIAGALGYAWHKFKSAA